MYSSSSNPAGESSSAEQPQSCYWFNYDIRPAVFQYTSPEAPRGRDDHNNYAHLLFDRDSCHSHHDRDRRSTSIRRTNNASNSSFRSNRGYSSNQSRRHHSRQCSMAWPDVDYRRLEHYYESNQNVVPEENAQSTDINDNPEQLSDANEIMISSAADDQDLNPTESTTLDQQAIIELTGGSNGNPEQFAVLDSFSAPDDVELQSPLERQDNYDQPQPDVELEAE